MTGVLVVLTLGVNVLFWATIGALRWLAERLHRTPPHRSGHQRITPRQVAVLIAAHNEELGIGATIAAAHQQVPHGNVFVVSDGSTDQTVQHAHQAGANVYDLNPNRGKAGALAAGITHFHLAEHFDVVMLLDADTAPAPDYLDTGLPLFDDPNVVAVAGRAATAWQRGDRLSIPGQILRAHRERVYVTFQLLFKYGQASKYTNAVTIVPGFASMYRTRVLSSIHIDAQGLAIEDFNMTFEVHAHRLGRIAFHPRAAIAYTQDPHTLPDYIKQVSRWSLGFWQTLLRHGLHPGTFWVALTAFVTELLTSSVLFVLLGPTLALTTTAQLWTSLAVAQNALGQLAATTASVLPPHQLLLSVAVPDYALTMLVAILQRRPIYLLFGLAFLPLRCLDAGLCLRSLCRTRSARSVGIWTSPQRRTPTTTALPSTYDSATPEPAHPTEPNPPRDYLPPEPPPTRHAITHEQHPPHIPRQPQEKRCPPHQPPLTPGPIPGLQ